MLHLFFSRRWWWTTLLVLAAISVTIRLSFWQVDRYRQNTAFADHLAAMRAAIPLVLDGGNPPAGLVEMEYRGVQAAGTYDFSRQVAVRNQVWVHVWGSEIGYILITPLVFPDGSAVLVDRGWIPLADNTSLAWRKYDQPGPVEVTGILRLPARPQMGGQPDPTLAPGQSSMDLWNLVDIERLQLQLPYPILPVYIQAAPDPQQAGMPYRALAEPVLSAAQVNVGYAFVWFSFAGLLIVGYPVYLRKQAESEIVRS